MNSEELVKSLDDADQKKRFASACKAENTPVSLDRENGSGAFKAHSAHGVYTTTLDSCNCHDFILRQRPCKHIYRLAMELGVLPGEYSSYLHGGYSWRDAVDMIEKYPENVQKEFWYNLSQTKRRPNGYKRKTNSELELLIKDGIIEEVEPPTRVFDNVRVILDFFQDYTKLSRYFGRKFCPPSDACLLPDGTFVEYASYPDDDVTALLVDHGFVDPTLVKK